MKCALCGYEFEISEGEVACRGCPLATYCSMVRCPNCGYKSPAEPRLTKLLRKWRKEYESK